jgi:hypothetical protein
LSLRAGSEAYMDSSDLRRTFQFFAKYIVKIAVIYPAS